MMYSVSSELYLEVAARLAEAIGGGSYFSADLVPVWWEFHTVGSDGEALNDFSFSEVRALL